MFPCRSAKQAFTLIELLVVIAIIAILAAILFPVFAQARAKARQTSCLSNQKQLGLAIVMYVQDYDETFPGLFQEGGTDNPPSFNSAQDFGWAQLIQPYVKNVQMFQCPSEPNPQVLTGGNVQGFSDYFMNRNFRGATSNVGVPLARMTAPANTIATGCFFSEHTASNHAGNSPNSATAGCTTPGQGFNYTTLSNPSIRHSEGAVYSFADGHSKWLRQSMLRNGCSSPETNTFTFDID
jgi:prepilin-type N-terminal cleavage/methylation domain-containing protein/prepilin-type processing-associated H-X9-DG protein